MSVTGEADNATVEQPTQEVAATELPQPAENPVKEKKPKAPKEKKPKTAKAVSHPPYFEMIKEALLALNEKGGSSPYAIAKYMEEKHKAVLPANFRKILGLQLKNSAAKGKLIKVKASYKLSEPVKKEKSTEKASKAVAAKKKTEQTKSTTNKVASKGKPAKKTEVVKKALGKSVKKTKRAAPTKAKQPKSIKSPAAKKAKKAAA